MVTTAASAPLVLIAQPRVTHGCVCGLFLPCATEAAVLAVVVVAAAPQATTPWSCLCATWQTVKLHMATLLLRSPRYVLELTSTSPTRSHLAAAPVWRGHWFGAASDPPGQGEGHGLGADEDARAGDRCTGCRWAGLERAAHGGYSISQDDPQAGQTQHSVDASWVRTRPALSLLLL